jgi:hypothetical protein
LALALSLAVLAGCTVPRPWPPVVERLPEGAAGFIAPASTAPPTLDEIVDMAAQGTPAQVIIQKLRDARAAYAIPPEQAQSLASRGVPAEVVAYLRYGERATAYAAATHYPYAYGLGYYGYHPYGVYGPYWSYPYGPAYGWGGAFFGFSRRW